MQRVGLNHLAVCVWALSRPKRCHTKPIRQSLIESSPLPREASWETVRGRIALFVSGFTTYAAPVSKKHGKIAALIEDCRGHELDAHYLGYFKCFNRQLFHEAHDVLEKLWLADKQGPNYSFYQALIQLAGAFVHLQKNRLRPAAALFKLARANLLKYPPVQERLDIVRVRALIEQWLGELESNHFTVNPLTSENIPMLHLISETGGR